MTEDQVLCERHGALALVTLSNPRRFNAMTRVMWRQLRSIFGALQADASVRCVLLRGQGGHFCAGGDISEYPDFRFSEAGLRDFHENDVWGGLQAILDCDAPVVAQIDGHCMGAGVEIACCCDIRIAAEAARFGAPIAKLGFPMAPRELALVLREAGALTIREMLLEAGALTAAQMQTRGFLHRVVPDPQAQAQASVQRILSRAPQAARLNKRALRTLHPIVAPDRLATLLPQAYAYADSAEHHEGIEAFLAKRPACFSQD